MSITLELRQTISHDEVIRWLTQAHYARKDVVTFYGQYSRVGDSITVFPVNSLNPVRIEFLGSSIDVIRQLDEELTKISSITLIPNTVDADGLVFEPEQYLVHIDHGIGQFRTLGMRQVGSFVSHTRSDQNEQGWQPYLILDYANGAELFVPPDQAHKLTHYIGSRAPVLSTLGSQRWQSTRKKVEESLFKLAKELLVIAAQREIHPREPHKIQPDWLAMVSDEFPHTETDDQSKAIADVISDLGKPKPMDRLICGDVGFGKTEVALRAAAAVASTGKQVALLAPTTLLTNQHAALFKERFKNLPVRVEGLNRFASESEQNRIVEDLKNGQVDIVIGTHRLLSHDIAFSNLGLLIIDEEQKFGVKHKEQLKKLRAEVDILTLSATPIPRTLFTGLSGLRDISLIQTPPKKRLAIETKVTKTSDELLVKAVLDEAKRGGQAFILHNDVLTIENRAHHLRQLMPDIRLEVAHGQMSEQRLSNTMTAMIEGKVDCLLTSTIIESGLDIVNANTLIVEKADHFGLSDLYQLRGRIGRGDRQAYAYFFYDVPELSRAAKMRFDALRESQELGSGYSIALRDLEIRGGGNVLGKEQHGNMEAIGLSLYTKLLQATIKKLQKN